jgi:hypothetical protein
MKKYGYKLFLFLFCSAGFTASLNGLGWTHLVSNNTDGLISVKLNAGPLYSYEQQIYPGQQQIAFYVGLQCISTITVQKLSGTAQNQSCYLIIPPDVNWCTSHTFNVNLSKTPVGTSIMSVTLAN